ncbi:iron-sulfur cluster repair di-iron protein [Flammeovirgaceae bacterium SG7u.111]|nr:iron-sulfur cluster repair di-iron protein [Flammeovirgaceae bacterium SG7u.132]WPO33364.1 iron-sulfur cluster repair di-iron protein [Flammeovirgaceae bacterium SG7u.111]
MNLYHAHSTLESIVATNYVYASVLHFFGIAFYEAPADSLKTACQKKGLDTQTVINSLESVSVHKQEKPDYALTELPVDVIIDYLKDAHKTFIRHKLPYVGDLIANIQLKMFDDPDVAKDLKFVFPIFAEDFIQHIYEEEKKCFGYIETLNSIQADKVLSNKQLIELNKYSIQKFWKEHETDDDEMEGIRELTNNYQITPATGLYTKVVYSELQNFEKDLLIHSRIENTILFPKAQKLETEMVEKLRRRSRLN